MKKKTILSVKDSRGMNHEDLPNIAQAFTDFYSDLFQSTKPSQQNINHVIDHIAQPLSSIEVGMVSQPFTPDDIKRALFQLGPTKAPGKDGFQPIFYQKFWDVVGSDLTQKCLTILNHGSALLDLNETDIVLIPKTKTQCLFLNLDL